MLLNIKAFVQHRPSLTIGLVFAINSILFGNWITRIPEVQNKLMLNDATLGLALLGISIGGLSIMPFTSWIMSKLGTGRTTLLFTILFCFATLLPVAASGFILLILALFFFGLTSGAMDVAMNAAAAAIEEKESRIIMSTCHGMFSLGAMVGAGLGSIFAGFSIGPLPHMSVFALLMLLLTLVLSPQILALPETRTEEAIFTLPKGPLLGLAFVGFCIMLGEGAVADWSAVYLQNNIGASPFLAGLGYAGFSLTMTLGRLAGDSFVTNWGARPVVQYGSLLGALGLFIVILLPHPLIVIAGFTLTGLGFSCVVPILFSAAAKVPGIASGTGIASVTTTGILGFLIGPPLIGFISEASSLSTGLGFVLVLSLLSFFISERMKMG